MTIAIGIAKSVAYKKEPTGAGFGVDLADKTGGTYLRRVTSDIDLSAANYESNELNTTYQIADMRLGLRQVGGTINGELSPKTYKDMIAAALRKAWVTGATTGTLNAIVSVTEGPLGTQKLTRSTGSFWTDGFKNGDIVRLTGFTGSNAGNINKNYRILTVTATDMFLEEMWSQYALGDATRSLVTQAATGMTSQVIAVTGFRCWVPTTGHTNDSFCFEHFFSDIAQSERFQGCRIAGIDINLPSTGMATIGVRVLGVVMKAGTSQWLTTPSAAPTFSTLAAVNGKLSYDDSEVGLVTGASIRIDSGATVGPVVGSNYSPDVFVGPVRVSGQLTAYFQDASIRDDFINETTPSLSIGLCTDNTGGADFMGFTLPKIKLGGATKSDGPQGLILTMPYTALEQGAGGSGTADEMSTIVVQDSQVLA